MKVLFDEIKIGEFFVFRLGDDINIYQKISPMEHYNAVHLNSGSLCNIYNENTKLEKVNIEFTIIENE